MNATLNADTVIQSLVQVIIMKSKHGSYKNSTTHRNDIDWFELYDERAQPYIDVHWWEWWSEVSKTLNILRITGGEF